MYSENSSGSINNRHDNRAVLLDSTVELSKQDPLIDTLYALFTELTSQFPSVTGIQLSNPLLDMNVEIGTQSMQSEKFALTNDQIWQGELAVYFSQPVCDKQSVSLSNLIHAYINGAKSGLKEYVDQYEDFTARSLLKPDPAIVENLCYREGRLCFRFRKSFSIMFVSCDSYEEAKNKYGEHYASSLLGEFCQLVSGEIRDYDFLLRYSENEFCILLNQVDINCANQIANRMIDIFDGKSLSDDRIRTPISASLGITEVNQQESVDHSIEIARHAMRLAQKRGGNQFVYSDGCFLY